ncbi:MAG TPA: YfiR family protein [Candidatus Aquilonibacter sp.]|nr:YfiR family protein [Candidatus Aquilonibacter sp.]
MTHRLPNVVLLLASVMTVGPVGAIQPVNAPSTLPTQADVEAVYLFDFGKFVRWPSGVDRGPFQICVAATHSFAAGVERTIANEAIDGRTLTVREISRPEEETGCAVLFIDASERERSDVLLRGAADKPLLTVSDLPDFLARGGMIQFQIIQNRVRFSVNLDAVNRSHLVMSSELLKVAVDVKGRAEQGGAP